MYANEQEKASRFPIHERPRCNRCFAEKEVSTVFQGSVIACCRACRYKIAEVMDFLSYYGIGIVLPDSTRSLPADTADSGAEDADSDEDHGKVANKPRRAKKQTD